MFAVGSGVPATGQGYTSEAVFQSMQDFDAIYDSGWYVTGEAAKLRDRLTPESTTYPIQFYYTRSPNRGAVHFYALETHPVPPQPGDGTAQPELHRGTVKYSGYFGPDKRGLMSSHFLGPAGSYIPGGPVDESTQTVSISLSSPGGNPPDYFRQIERGLGRGFTRFATDVRNVEEQSDGLLKVTMASTEHSPGEWRLLVDPKLGYLVREGHYFRANREDAVVHVRTVGLFEGEEGIFVPAGGEYESKVGLYIGPMPIVVHSAVLGERVELVEKVKADLDNRNFDQAILVEDSEWISVRDGSGQIKRMPLNIPADLRIDMDDVEGDIMEEILANVDESELPNTLIDDAPDDHVVDSNLPLPNESWAPFVFIGSLLAALIVGFLTYHRYSSNKTRN